MSFFSWQALITAQLETTLGNADLCSLTGTQCGLNGPDPLCRSCASSNSHAWGQAQGFTTCPIPETTPFQTGNTDGKVDERLTQRHTGNLNQNSLNRSLCLRRSLLSSPKVFLKCHAAWGLFCPPLKTTKFLWMAPSNWTGQNLHRSEQATCTSQNWDCLCSLSMLLRDLSLSYGHQWTHYVSNTE